MKNITINANYVDSSKNFLKRVSNACPDYVTSIDIIEGGMEMASGYGQYKYFLQGSVNGRDYFNFKEHTTSSQVWDWYNETEPNRRFINWKKNLIIYMLGKYFESI